MPKLKFSPFYIFSHIPFKILYLFSDLSFSILYYVMKYRRKVVLSNLKNSFPAKNKMEIKTIEKAFYKHFCDLIFETIKAFTIREKGIKKRFHVKNPELIDAYFKQNKSIILYLGHYGNWEWLAFLPFFLPHQIMTFYRKLSNNYFDQLIKKSRERFGIKAIKSGKGYRSLVEHAKKNILTFTFMLGDQSPQKNNAKHWVQFLNQETAFFVGTERIAKKINQVVIYPQVTKRKRGIYEVEFLLLAENMNALEDFELINRYAKMLESSITKQPELWLWSHRRWKLKNNMP